MNIKRITDEFPSDDPEALYLVECAMRVAEMIPWRGDPLEVGVALVRVLSTVTIHFTDGFVLGDHREPMKILGFAEAEMVVGAASLEVADSARPEWGGGLS